MCPSQHLSCPSDCMSVCIPGWQLLGCYFSNILSVCSSVFRHDCLSLCACSLPVPLLFFLLTQLSSELGMNIRPKQSLTFAKCLEMGLQNHVEEISKVGEVAGKEYAIEQVSGWGARVKLTISMVSTITGSCGYSKQMYVHAFSV